MMPLWRASVALLFCLPALGAETVPAPAPALWQERYYFDALIEARDRQERTSSDPEMIPVMQSVAAQLAQQALNLRRIDLYVGAQQGNLGFAFAQRDPGASLATIVSNFQTLARGSDQIRDNLDYLAVRCRLASSQALPDASMERESLVILAQVRQIQLNLNSLYENASAVDRAVEGSGSPPGSALRLSAQMLLNSVRRTQNAVFAAYNSAYALAQHCR